MIKEESERITGALDEVAMALNNIADAIREHK